VITTVTVGQFATMTHLSIKTLRYYHQVGLLEPRRIDPHSGYRHYSVDQATDAQLIRRLRDLRMPIADIRSVLLAQSTEQRQTLIRAHLDHLEQELEATRLAVLSLRTLLDSSADLPTPVTRGTQPAQPALAISTHIHADDVLDWWTDTLQHLHALTVSEHLTATGPIGGIYDEALFRHEAGSATLFIPVENPIGTTDAEPIVVPEADTAIIIHRGSHRDIDLAYSRLGTYIAHHSLTAGPTIREQYLRDASHTSDERQWQTQICWPVTAATP
jgi:DNA-binding transcriptional MerR regulator/effector-binding domain-containing protein